MSLRAKERIFAILGSLAYLILGCLVFIYPNITLSSISMLIGWIMLVGGVFTTIDGFRLPGGVSLRNSYIVDGILLVLLGFLFIFGNGIFGTMVLAYTLIFWFISSSMIEIYIDSRIGGAWGIISIILNVLVIILSIMALFDPMFAEGILVWVLSFAFIFAGVSRLFIAFAPKEELDDFNDALK